MNWELELPSSHKERISRQQSERRLNKHLGCALQETSLQKLLASDTILFGNKIKHKFVEYFDIVFSSNTVDQ